MRSSQVLVLLALVSCGEADVGDETLPDNACATYCAKIRECEPNEPDLDVCESDCHSQLAGASCLSKFDEYVQCFDASTCVDNWSDLCPSERADFLGACGITP